MASLDMTGIVAALQPAWAAYRDHLMALEAYNIPWVHINLLDLLRALPAAVLVRTHIGFRMHWLRSLMTTWLLTVSGGSLALMLLGRPPRWMIDVNTCNAVFAVWYLAFQMPGDWFFRAFCPARGQRAALSNAIMDVIVAVGTAVGVSLHGAERVWETQDGLSGRAHFMTYVVIGVLAGCGSGLIAEVLNLFLLEAKQYRSPAAAPPAPAVLCILLSIAYVTIRNPTHLPWLPSLSREDACAAITLASLLLQAVISAEYSVRLVTAALEAIPGWKSSFVPAHIGAGPVAEDEVDQGTITSTSVFGYERTDGDVPIPDSVFEDASDDDGDADVLEGALDADDGVPDTDVAAMVAEIVEEAATIGTPVAFNMEDFRTPMHTVAKPPRSERAANTSKKNAPSPRAASARKAPSPSPPAQPTRQRKKPTRRAELDEPAPKRTTRARRV